MADSSIPTSNGARSQRALVCQRWVDLGLLLLTATAVGMALCPSLEIAQERVTGLMLPWGWAGDMFLGLVGAAGAWVMLRSLGANLTSIRRWVTNPPAWPAGIIAFMFCSFVWQCRIGPERMSDMAWAIQGFGAMLLFLCGRPLALLVARASNGAAPKRVSTQKDPAVGDLDELAKAPDRLIEWLEREEPVSGPAEDYFDAAPYARRIAALMRENPVRTVGLIGPYGCGKSSILRMAHHYLRDSSANAIGAANEGLRRLHDIIVCEVSGWGFQEGTIAHHILDTAIRYGLPPREWASRS